MSKIISDKTSNSVHSFELNSSQFSPAKKDINENFAENLETTDLKKILKYTRFEEIANDFNDLKESKILKDTKQDLNKEDINYLSEDKFSNLTDFEKLILKSNLPIQLNNPGYFDILEETPVCLNEENKFKSDIAEAKYILNIDKNPEIFHKKFDKKIEYIQELAIRYLRPPTPSEVGAIIIKQEPNIFPPPAPPLIIRQQPPRPLTPEPLVFREEPPPAPAKIEPTLITISGKQLPPPPRKVIIERLAQLPSKPQSVIIERWLPYPKLKRKVIFQKSNTVDPVVVKPKNVIVQWEQPEVLIKKDYKYLGIVKANPSDYIKRFGRNLKPAKDLPQFVLDIKPPDGIVLAADHHHHSSFYELEGEVQALNLIDLEKEGLSEYIPLLQKSNLNDETKKKFLVQFNSKSSILNSNSNYSTVLTSSQYRIEKIFPEITLRNDANTLNTRG